MVIHPVIAQQQLLEAFGLKPDEKPYIRSAVLKLVAGEFISLTVEYVLTEEEQIGLISTALANYELLRREDA